ncbi:Vanillate O-demethylase ferredoxin subunit OS=Castellaniella defragrans OX=75697 GN=HNR28_001895 PE=4 SV=1 [Castellaniella defragrans]
MTEPALAPEPDDELPLLLRIRRKTQVARGIHAFELVADDGSALPAFTPGSHIRLRTPSGLLHKYSLCNAPEDAAHYLITVKRDAEGRGGSISMADDATEGQSLRAQAPDNAFTLPEAPESLTFIAGGIGITPFLSMMAALGDDPEIPWKLIYLTHTAETTAYLERLSRPELAPRVTIHHSAEHGDHYNLWPILEKPNKGHVFCCGPRSLMEDVRDMSGHWTNGRIHFESFLEGGVKKPDNQPFTVTLAHSGQTFEIPVGQSILAVLRKAGVAIPSSCESGTCGTCRTGLLEGAADHRDMVLMPEEQDHQIMVCVSRARSENLVLDR